MVLTKSKNLFTLLLLLLSISSDGQQVLWSTIEKDDIKLIPYNRVIKEVLEYYDLYDYYFDHTGYSKETLRGLFLKDGENNTEDLNVLDSIKESSVISMKVPSEKGAYIMVVSFNKDVVNTVIFSNVIYQGAISTYNGEMEDERGRFIKWFKTLLN